MSGRGRTSMFHTARSKKPRIEGSLPFQGRDGILPLRRTGFLTPLLPPPRARWHGPCSGAAARGVGMRSSWQWVGLAVVVAAIAIGVACGGGGSEDHSVLGPADSGYAGPADAGPDGGPPDAGPTDGGTPLEHVIFPTTANWDFYGPQTGGPQ